MARVTIHQRNGETVSFTTRPGKRKRSHKPNVYARFVGKEIGKHLKKGKTATAAMKLVAKEWRSKGSGKTPRRGGRNMGGNPLLDALL